MNGLLREKVQSPALRFCTVINTPYVKNKIIIENYIVKNFKKYLIVRLPEVVEKVRIKKH